MDEQLDLLPDVPQDRPGRTRTDDWSTSKEGARNVAAYRAGTQKARLLAAYHVLLDATDEEAAKKAQISMLSCYWKRAGELRQDGLIEPVKDEEGTVVTRTGNAGTSRIVCRITEAGEKTHQRLVAPDPLF